jgi:zinc transporter
MPQAAPPGLIWGFDLSTGEAQPIEECDAGGEGFRWFHLSLAHQGTTNWITRGPLPAAVKELLLGPDTHQRALVEDGVVGCVLHDFERDFEGSDTNRIGALRVALTPNLMITARMHPIRSADLVRNRLAQGQRVAGPAAALDLVAGTISEALAGVGREMSIAVQRAEDDFLDGRNPPNPRALIGIRRRVAQVHRMLDGMRALFRRLEEDEDLPEPLLPTVEKLSQRLRSLDADAVSVQGQLRLLRDEIDMQADQRTNQNLYLLSIVTALLLPATLVTGLFGMNTGGMPWAQSPHGTWLATLLAIGAAATTYFLLRAMGFMRR